MRKCTYLLGANKRKSKEYVKCQSRKRSSLCHHGNTILLYSFALQRLLNNIAEYEAMIAAVEPLYRPWQFTSKSTMVLNSLSNKCKENIRFAKWS